MNPFLPAIAFVVAFASSAFAGGGIEIDHAWARTVPGAKNGAVYFTVRNTGATEDTLTGVESGVAAKAELHESRMVGQIMKMDSLADIVVPAGGMVEFKPGGRHVMLVGLKSPLTEGHSFTLTLKFKTAGAKAVTVEVKNTGAAPPSGGMSGMH